MVKLEQSFLFFLWIDLGFFTWRVAEHGAALFHEEGVMKVIKFVQVLIVVTVTVGLWGFFFADEVVTFAEALNGHCVANCGGGGSSGGSSSGGSRGGWSAPRGSSPAQSLRGKDGRMRGLPPMIRV